MAVPDPSSMGVRSLHTAGPQETVSLKKDGLAHGAGARQGSGSSQTGHRAENCGGLLGLQNWAVGSAAAAGHAGGLSVSL